MGVSIYTLQTEEALGLQKESNQGELCSQNILPSFAVSYNCHLLVNGRCLHFEALVVDGS